VTRAKRKPAKPAPVPKTKKREVPAPRVGFDALLNRIERKGHKKINQALAGAVGAVAPAIAETAEKIRAGLEEFNAFLGDDDDEDAHDGEDEEDE